jgi:hypothetical protein
MKEQVMAFEMHILENLDLEGLSIHWKTIHELRLDSVAALKKQHRYF